MNTCKRNIRQQKDLKSIKRFIWAKTMFIHFILTKYLNINWIFFLYRICFVFFFRSPNFQLSFAATSIECCCIDISCISFNWFDIELDSRKQDSSLVYINLKNGCIFDRTSGSWKKCWKKLIRNKDLSRERENISFDSYIAHFVLISCNSVTQSWQWNARIRTENWWRWYWLCRFVSFLINRTMTVQAHISSHLSFSLYFK